uniref:Putative toll/interleukin-1 receptor (TIR) domain-containing protein n=1 Tax=Helianthus annuus TaxID=4232 RepID=A0A251SL00_HELAN
MASSSATSSDHNKKYQYDVFLSFSGEDTRRSFVDHLNNALQGYGIRTFKDDERLQKGKEIKDALLKSIEDSRFCIIVFSKKYASSSWCLDELVKIMKCQKTTDQTAFPVFYDVEPTEVRKQSGSVGEAFAKHTNKVVVLTPLLKKVFEHALARHTNEKLGKWRKALKDAANLSGWELKNTADGHEAKVIKLIVERVSLELRSVNMGVDENLVGMEQRMKALDPYLESGSNDVRMVGIKGMGGAGKTTLARAIFDKISINFEAKSFVEDVREHSKAPLLGLKKLQEQVLRDVLGDKSITISSVHEGTNLMKTMLCGKKVLIVLDDVDHRDQLERLVGNHNWFKLGSRIIITTRDEHVLIAHGVKYIHDVNLLLNEEAIRLFRRHAFREDIPTEEYDKQSLEVIHYAAGLPLTIKVLGSFLCGKSKPEWIEALARLKTIPLQETLTKLELSYENLEDDYKKIFLDVACFYRHLRLSWAPLRLQQMNLLVSNKVIRMLESRGFKARNGLRVLHQKCLITVDKEWNLIHMHDHIEEMGKNIVRREHRNDPTKHSRLWVQEEIEYVLANDLVRIHSTCKMEIKIT